MRRAGRSRGIPASVEAIHVALHRDQLRQPAQVEAATAQHATALLHALDAAVANVTRLEQQLETAFDQHPGAELSQASPA